MTKLGFHVASDKRTGVGELLKAGAALAVCCDQNMIVEAKRAGAVVAFRTQKAPGEDNPHGIDREELSNIPARAFEWMNALIPVWKQNAGADYYLVNNEWDIGDLKAGMLINVFALECMKMAELFGYRLGILNFSTGCPSDDPIEGLACSMEDRLIMVLPALQYAAAHDHAISLHVHAVDRGDLQVTGEAIALRYRRLLRFCQNHGFTPKILITELSNGVGGVEPNMSRYLAAIEWWDQAVQKDPMGKHVVGGALYGFNEAETLTPAVARIAEIMRRTHEEPQPEPQPEPEKDVMVQFRGTCLESSFDRIAAAVMSNGGTIEKTA